MRLRTLFTTAFVASTVVLSACTTETDAPNATSEVMMNVQEVPSESAEKPGLSATISTVVTATVIAIDHKTRLVTLKDEQGEPVTFTADKEVRNLDQVNVGDTVKANYVENFSFKVLATKNPEAAAKELTAISRAEEGDMPGVAIIDSQVAVLTVEEINLKANTFKLKNAAGEVLEFNAREPKNLQKASVGDVVVMTYTEMLTIVVEEKSAK